MTTEFVNPPRVRELLDQYHKLLTDAKACRDEATKLSGNLLADAVQYEDYAAIIKAQMRGVVEALGNYKDGDSCAAYIEERIGISYNPVSLRQVAPDFAKACIEEVVNSAKVKGLLKGGLVTELQLEPATERHVTKAFIVR